MVRIGRQVSASGAAERGLLTDAYALPRHARTRRTTTELPAAATIVEICAYVRAFPAAFVPRASALAIFTCGCWFAEIALPVRIIAIVGNTVAVVIETVTYFHHALTSTSWCAPIQNALKTRCTRQHFVA